MARMVIEGINEDFYHRLKVEAVTEKTTVKDMVLATLERFLDGKAEGQATKKARK